MDNEEKISTIFEVAWFWRDGFDSQEHSVAFFKDKPSIGQLEMLGLKKKSARKLWLKGRTDVGPHDTVFLLEHVLNNSGYKEIIRAKSKWEGL